MQEIIDSLKSLGTKIENKLAFALTIIVGTSLLYVAFKLSRDTVFLKMLPDETGSMKKFYYCQMFPYWFVC